MLRALILLLPLFCIGCFSTPDAQERERDDDQTDNQSDQTDQTDQTDQADQTDSEEKDERDEKDIKDENEDEDEGNDDPVPDVDTAPLRAVEVLFDDQIRTKVLAELDAAQESVRFVSFTFSDSGVMSKLNGLAGNGVDVRGVIGTPVEAGSPSFPLKIYEDTGDGIVHEKFFVIDEATVLLSSANIAYNNILNFLVIFRDAADLAARLADEFDEFDTGRRGAAKSRPCAEGCPVENGTLYLSPSSCDAVGGMLDALPAGAEAWLAMYTLTDSAPMYDELLALPGRGVTLHATLDDWDSGGDPANQAALDDLDAAGAAVAYYDGSMLFHHKFFVTGDIVEFGSMNWTYSGCQKNDELYFITTDPLLVAPFLGYAQER